MLALVVSARKLRPYYQAHRVIVMTDFPLRSILHSPDASQRLMNWAIKLSQYNLLYRPKTTIKAQDGASNQKGARVGVVITTPDGTLLEQAITLGFPASNNEAEYEALLASLSLAKELATKKLAIYSYSQLITNQASSEYMAKHPRMILYLDKFQELLKAFPTFTIQQVPRIDEDPSWQDPIVDYLMNGNLPTDKFEARKVQQKAARHYMHVNKLIRISYSGLHLTCIKYPLTLEVLYKIHEGKSGNHF
ncbi:hypothetical protein L3X38_005311 [Prunus dulcis]|uniref:RNase H type-1 domain-containing protein n=1 Tax=Prunus dulcis TaxID=3755 RepID=A0AAD4ZQJ6_PRUDU|nr:hypothetical protein L3X38_005311 [Prunus dulcis]